MFWSFPYLMIIYIINSALRRVVEIWHGAHQPNKIFKIKMKKVSVMTVGDNEVEWLMAK